MAEASALDLLCKPLGLVQRQHLIKEGFRMVVVVALTCIRELTTTLACPTSKTFAAVGDEGSFPTFGFLSFRCSLPSPLFNFYITLMSCFLMPSSFFSFLFLLLEDIVLYAKAKPKWFLYELSMT